MREENLSVMSMATTSPLSVPDIAQGVAHFAARLRATLGYLGRIALRALSFVHVCTPLSVTRCAGTPFARSKSTTLWIFRDAVQSHLVWVVLKMLQPFFVLCGSSGVPSLSLAARRSSADWFDNNTS